MQLSNIGAYIKPVPSLFPQAAAAGSLTGASVDRDGFESCVLSVAAGVVTGAPSGLTIDCQVQHSADGATDWTNLGATIPTIVAASAESRVNVDLSTAFRYIRATSVITFTGGTSPGIPMHAAMILGGAKTLPTP
jgi:hypothetical protein